jgi:protein-S-isoprenylcysteine O-methyltransferase Ste14
MRKPVAAMGSAVFFVLAPGSVLALGPWLLTRWRWRDLPASLAWASVPLRLLGTVLVIAGVAVVLVSFARFVGEGVGTPAPVAPPRHLVVGGFYRYVRNPMYVAVITASLGQALLLYQPVLVVYTAAVAAAMFAFVRLYEEPGLTRRFGAEYVAYRRGVPGWWPRLHPYQASTGQEPR